MKKFKYIKEYIFKQKSNLFVFLLFSIIAWIISIASPYLTGNYIDVLVEVKSGEEIISFTTKILFIGVLNIISLFITNYVLSHVIRLPMLYFKDIDSTYLIKE